MRPRLLDWKLAARVTPLPRFSLERAGDAYALMLDGKCGKVVIISRIKGVCGPSIPISRAIKLDVSDQGGVIEGCNDRRRCCPGKSGVMTDPLVFTGTICKPGGQQPFCLAGRNYQLQPDVGGMRIYGDGWLGEVAVMSRAAMIAISGV